jgi:hypothetical protein
VALALVRRELKHSEGGGITRTHSSAPLSWPPCCWQTPDERVAPAAFTQAHSALLKGKETAALQGVLVAWWGRGQGGGGVYLVVVVGAARTAGRARTARMKDFMMAVDGGFRTTRYGCKSGDERAVKQ